MAHDLKNRTQDVLNLENEDKTFEHFQFQSPILEGLKVNGYQVPSPIQVSALPYTLAGLDVLVQSKSGTGKTLVYVLSALSSIDVESNELQGLLIAPTREIAVQGAQTMLEIGGHLSKLKASTFIGGMSVEEDKLKLKKCHMAFGSPGRVKQLIEEGVMNVSQLKVFILDEADKLCEKSFKEDLSWIMRTLPEIHQTLALSATFPNSLENTLISKLKNPTHVRLGQDCQVLLGVNQFVLESPSHGLVKKVVDYKFESLLKLISNVSFEQCIVFCNYSLRARAICDKLNDRGWPAIFLAGMQEQKDRLNSLKDLKTFRCRIVLTTDLSARGIDARHVNFVINFDVPSQGTTYLHRIGRAGRYGSRGIALTIASKGDEMKNVSNIAKSTNSDVRVTDDPESDLWNVAFNDLNALQQGESQNECLKGACQDSRKEKSPSVESIPSLKKDSDCSSQPKISAKVKKRPSKPKKSPPREKEDNISISKETMDYLEQKDKEFEECLNDINESTKNMSLETILSKTVTGELFPHRPKINKEPNIAFSQEVKPEPSSLLFSSTSTSCPMDDNYNQWIHLWKRHQIQHQQYLNYMLQCQGILP
ncbi:uncharacterized protein [Lepeophtheirus salmonis]|uniref:uncharacterized protein n=1 Tax=Lepeophtheirus salmonis TaxID=72036 RepID=UPI001AE6EF12|nr:probable ATP-dependent RNA helicase DDX20 isoform X1 [Lepeophtheirus salmonis]